MKKLTYFILLITSIAANGQQVPTLSEGSIEPVSILVAPNRSLEYCIDQRDQCVIYVGNCLEQGISEDECGITIYECIDEYNECTHDIIPPQIDKKQSSPL